MPKPKRTPTPPASKGETGRWAILVRHPGFVPRLVADTSEPDPFRSLPGDEHWLGEPPIRYWSSRQEAETSARSIQEARGSLYRFDVIPEVLRAVLEYPEDAR
jgi:hypothetical protein